MTNSWDPSMWLAPAAALALAAGEDSPHPARAPDRRDGWWRQVRDSRLDQISFRAALPLVLTALVIAPQIAGSLSGIAAGALIALDIESPYVVTAEKGLSFKTMLGPRRHQPPAVANSYNEGIAAISSLNLNNEAIANLDFSNPFPVLFLAPPPRGIHVWFHWGFNFPQDTVLRWQEVIGDACVVTLPANPGEPDISGRLVELVRSKLETDFELVFHSESWKIYRRRQDCATASARVRNFRSPGKDAAVSKT